LRLCVRTLSDHFVGAHFRPAAERSANRSIPTAPKKNFQN
jgi:hypothetical protein